MILSNPGGPGSAGKVLVSLSEQLPKGIGAKYDWIGINVRGTGNSTPLLDFIGDESSVHRLPSSPKAMPSSETFDGATPYHGALEARRLFPTSSLVEGLNGATHSGTLSAGECVQVALYDFFSEGKLPARVSGDESDKKCEPVQPETGRGEIVNSLRSPRFR